MIEPIRTANIGQPGIEVDQHGDPAGKAPRRMDRAELRAVGHEAMPVLKAIRAKCLDCTCGSPGEVRACIITSCPLWPFRMAGNPWREGRTLSEGQRMALASRRGKSSQISTISDGGGAI